VLLVVGRDPVSGRPPGSEVIAPSDVSDTIRSGLDDRHKTDWDPSSSRTRVPRTGFIVTGGVVGPVPDDDYPADLFGTDEGDAPEPSDEVVRAHRYARAVPENVPAR
jgi:hypothetical protein